MTLLVENPITRKRVAVEAPAKVPSRYRRAVALIATQAGVTPKYGLALASYLGFPTRVVGEGAFGIVYAHPSRKDRVIKITRDSIDGTTAARIAQLQRLEKNRPEPNINTITAKVYNVEKVSFVVPQFPRERSWPVWILEVERVIPLDKLPSQLKRGGQSRDAADMSLVLRAIMEHFDADRYLDVQTEVYEMLQEAAGDTVVWPRGLVAKMKDCIEWFAEKIHKEALKAQGKNRSPLAVTTAAKMAMALNLFLRRGLLLIDMHKYNWGVRVRGRDRFDVVALDFGMSSPGRSREKDLRYRLVALEA